MNKSTKGGLVLAISAVLSVLAIQAPASAAYGTDVTHSRNDSGYTADIKARCNSGKIVYLSRGDSTAFGSSEDACTGTGVDAIYTGLTQAVQCFNNLPGYGSYYYVGTGWHGVPSWASLDCFMQRPL